LIDCIRDFWGSKELISPRIQCDLREITLATCFIIYRSGEEQTAADASQHQLAIPEPSERFNEDANVNSGISTSARQAGHTGDLAQQLQRAVRDEMRRLMEVCCCE